MEILTHDINNHRPINNAWWSRYYYRPLFLEFDYHPHACQDFLGIAMFLCIQKHVNVHYKSTALTRAPHHQLTPLPDGCALAVN